MLESPGLLTTERDAFEGAGDPLIFHRDGFAPIDDGLSELLASPQVSDRALARNLERDHRVGPERAGSFFDQLYEPETAAGLKRGVTDYFLEQIRSRPDPAFLDIVNAGNFVSGYGEPSPRINPYRELVRIVELNGLAGVVYRQAQDRQVPELSDLPADTNPDGSELVAWLDEKLDGRTQSEVQSFVRSSLEAINALIDSAPFQPTWATSWSTFEHLSELEPIRWLEALGMRQPPAPRWIIVLRYQVREAGTLVRPTQLDAGTNALHFPSPPEAPLKVGGHPMHLSAPEDAEPLPDEYIHQQISHTLDHWVNGGEICRRIDPVASSDLQDRREAHRERLAGSYSSAVLAWMPDVL